MAKAFAKILGHEHSHHALGGGEVDAILKLVTDDKDHHKGLFHWGRSERPPLPLVTEHRYFAFWKALSQPNAATDYLEALFKRVAELEPDERAGDGQRIGKRRTSRRSWTYGLQYRTSEGKLVSPGSPQLTRSFKTPPQRPPSFEIKDNGMAALLNTALLLALFQDVDFEKPGIVEAIDYVPEHLKSAAESWRHTVTHILKLLKTSRTKSISTILALCAAFMSSSMCASDNSLIEPLKKLEDVVQCFTFWSYPVGYHALQTLNSIFLEKKAPGHAMNKRCLLNDIRLSSQSGGSRSNTESRGRIYLLLNPQSARSFALQSLVDCKRAETLSSEDDAARLHFLKVLQACQMLKTSGVHVKEMVCKLPVSTISTLHDRLIEVQEEASQMEVENAVKHRRQTMADAWNEIVQACKSGQISAATMSWKEEVGDFTAARLLPLEFFILHTEPKWRPNPLEVHETSDAPGPMPAQYSRSAVEIAIREALDTSPFGSKGKSLQSVRSTSEVVRILVGGGDGTIHSTLLGYVNLVVAGVLAGGQQTSSSAQMLDVLFCILPAGRSNLLATYIAQRDLWYDAMIYRAIKSKLPVVPHVSESEHKFLAQLPEKSSSSSNLVHRSEALPSSMLTRQIENYVLEAGCVLKLTVFNCEAWYRDDKGNKFLTTIPFCTRAEIGVPAVAVSSESHKKVLHQQCVPRSPAKDHLEDADRLEDLVSSYTLKARLRYRPAGLDGSERGERNIPLSLVALMAINVPKPAERRLECNPSDEVLNVCVLQAADSKRRRLRALEELMGDMCTFRTRKLVVEAGEPGKAFDVVLDGEVYGPFYRVRLGPCYHPFNRDAAIKFSLTTFWPTHISRQTS
ncbi:uncharacterized protein LOC112346426 [Selaginella moellendorffii]|uniref:uncharacterized protein LOC112346426 n=1 Tax=Selaginella moellendorffii TaxID=88036 RepID=UPI000D1CA1DD|nr:uncharacterized protein LOC112346426 [Selaginella moellendorffii]|eukprot:XP_024531183.1 uncharacterized protein LOC112346426 [Selaginella moellendorffii]